MQRRPHVSLLIDTVPIRHRTLAIPVILRHNEERAAIAHLAGRGMKRRTRQRLRFFALVTEHRRFIKAVARRMSRNDRDLYDDLIQDALFALWRLDPSAIAKAPGPLGAERGMTDNVID